MDNKIIENTSFEPITTFLGRTMRSGQSK